MRSIFEKIVNITYMIGDVNYRATGFFYRQAGDDYLITNRHVVEHEHGVSPDNLRIVIRPKSHGVSPIPRKIQLFSEEDEERWLVHPSIDNIDIAAVPLRFSLIETGNTAFSSHNILPENLNLQLAGSSAIVLGFPERFGAGETNTPIARNSLISTEFGHNFQEKPKFLIDANLQKGMSGSPVLLKPAGLFHEDQSKVFSSKGTGHSSRLLGVHSGPIEYQNELNLHNVWYSKLIREIINSYESES